MLKMRLVVELGGCQTRVFGPHRVAGKTRRRWCGGGRHGGRVSRSAWYIPFANAFARACTRSFGGGWHLFDKPARGIMSGRLSGRTVRVLGWAYLDLSLVLCAHARSAILVLDAL